MGRRFPAVWLLLFSFAFTALVSHAQEPPQRVATSTGIYDVQSREDIHKFSASEINTLVRMENGRNQGSGTIPHPILVYCFDEKTFHYTGGKYNNAEINYRLHTPKNIRYGRKYPLIVHLHGVGEAGSNNLSSLVHLHSILPLMIGSDRQDFFMLVVQCPSETPGWSFRSTKDGTLDVLVAAIEHVLAEYPIDKRRITATGVSSGGRGVWELILRHPDMFAGAVPTACDAPQQLQQLAALTKTPVWSIINKGDKNPAPILVAMHVINDSGGSAALTETNASGHNAWRPAMEDYNCFRWMLAQKRGSWFAPSPGVIVHKPYPLLLAFLMFVLPTGIIVFLLWETIWEWIANARQSVQEWMDGG
jgi:predicted esterase